MNKKLLIKLGIVALILLIIAIIYYVTGKVEWINIVMLIGFFFCFLFIDYLRARIIL